MLIDIKNQLPYGYKQDYVVLNQVRLREYNTVQL